MALTIAAANQPQVDMGILIDKSEVIGSLAGFGFNLTNASPALFDLAPHAWTPSDTNDTPNGVVANYKTTGGNLTLAFPLDGSLTLNPFTAQAGVFAARPLGINGLVGASPYYALADVACSVPAGVELFAGPIA